MQSLGHRRTFQRHQIAKYNNDVAEKLACENSVPLTAGLAMNAVRRSLNACFVRMFCSAVRWTLFGVPWTLFGVRRCCRLRFVRLSSTDLCSVRSFVHQGWAPLVLFLVLFGDLCFVRHPRPAKIGNLTKYRKNIEKSILPLKILRISCWVPEGQWNQGNPEFQRNDIFRHVVRPAGRFSEIWQKKSKKYRKIYI